MSSLSLSRFAFFCKVVNWHEDCNWDMQGSNCFESSEGWILSLGNEKGLVWVTGKIIVWDVHGWKDLNLDTYKAQAYCIR